jgi:hypothetical protein
MTAATLLRAATAAVAFVITVTVAAAQTTQDKRVEKTFVEGGTASLTLRSGDYEIVPSADNRIRVIVRDSLRNAPEETSVQIAVKGSRADLSIESPETEGVDVRIEVPKRTNLVVRLTAGEIHVGAIEGSKDISARAGEIDIEVGDPARYRSVKASVTAGEIKGAPFNADKEGLFRSFSWQGTGKDDLTASLWAGEIRMR